MSDGTATEEGTAGRTSLKGTKVGKVVSDKRDKTVKVAVNYFERHPKYGKFVRKRSSFHVHDPDNSARIGDTVEIAHCRPISKTKAWRLFRIVETAAGRAHD